MSRRVGYVVSRFPKTTETFILREMAAVEAQGWHVVPFAINRERREIVQTGAAGYVERLRAISDLAPTSALGAQWRLLRRRPGRLARLWTRAIVGNISSPKFLVRALVCAWGAPALAERAVDDEVVHLHAHWGTHSAMLAYGMSIITGIPFSVTLHAHDLHVDRTMLAEKLASATDVVTISEHNAALIRADFPAVAERTSVVHCGVDVAALASIGAAHERAPGSIVCVAGLRGFKGHRYLLGAIRLLEQRGHTVRCHLVGDGPLRAELEADAPDSVVFHGALEVERALEIVAGSSVFVMPSVELADGRRDGIPVALMEAMAIGVPVVATSVSGIPELVVDGETGVLVPPEDETALADAIERLLGDATHADRLARYAAARVGSDFRIETTGTEMVRVFERSTFAGGDG